MVVAGAETRADPDTSQDPAQSGSQGADPKAPLGADPSVASPKLFLEPQPYRRRRWIDAARLLPVFGVLLLVVPPGLLPAGRQSSTTSLFIYLFLVWVALICAAALVGYYMRRADQHDEHSNTPLRVRVAGHIKHMSAKILGRAPPRSED